MGGRKTFSPGDILQAADVQDFLMDQSVMVFGGTAARGSGIASPTEGMFAYRTDADVLEFYNGSAWIPASVASGAATVTNRNLLYNGAMQVSQRGTSTTSITSSGYYTADRWVTTVSSMGTWTQDIQTDAPSGSGFVRSFRLLCTTADAAPAGSDVVLVQHRLEGQDVQRIAKGTASAQELTISFWVKSNVTGTYIVGLADIDNSRFVSASYSISASATWEKKTITFPADTTGVFDNNNELSLQVSFGLGSGSDRTSSPLLTAWGTGTTNLYTGQTNLAAATNNYWQVTGVQLEVGDAATGFEFKSYGQELRECQRYFWRESGDGPVLCNIAYYTSTSAYGVLATKVPMRTQPTLIQTTGTNFYTVLSNNNPDGFDSISAISDTSANAVRVDVTSGISGTAGHAGWLRSANVSSSIALSAEL